MSIRVSCSEVAHHGKGDDINGFIQFISTGEEIYSIKAAKLVQMKFLY